MLLEELLIEISNKISGNMNQSMLAESLGITRQTVSNRIKNNSQVTVSEIKKVEEYFNITLFENSMLSNKGMTIDIDYYKDVFASCGDGKIIYSEEKTKIPVATCFISGFSDKKSYSLINAVGNSMSPTIDSGDKLIVEHWKGEQIQDNKMYAFCFNNEIFVKRLSKNLDEIIIKSDNPDYRIRTINGSTMNEIILIGKIVGIIKSVS